MTKASSKKNKSTAEDDVEGFSQKGTIYIGHLPHGFYEEALSGFFRQFGRVTRVKVARNRQTGRPRGYAHVEFQYRAIAKVAAETMNNYIMFQKALQCKLLAPEEVPQRLMEDDFKLPPRHKKATQRHNQHKSDETVQRNGLQLVKRYLAKKAKLAELGIDYELQDYEDVIKATPDIVKSREKTTKDESKKRSSKKSRVTKEKTKKVRVRVKKKRQLSKYVRPPTFVV